jgi:hypothetical protein
MQKFQLTSRPAKAGFIGKLAHCQIIKLDSASTYYTRRYNENFRIGTIGNNHSIKSKGRISG